MSSSCATPPTFDCATLSIIGHALPLSTMTRAGLATPQCVDAGTRTDVLSAASQIDSLQWLASSCNDRLCFTPTSARPPDHKRPFVFDQDNRCFSVRPQGRFSVPTCRTTLRRAQLRSRLAGGHRRSRRNAVLTAASTARGSIGPELQPTHIPHRSPYRYENVTAASGGVTAPLLFFLDYR